MPCTLTDLLGFANSDCKSYGNRTSKCHIKSILQIESAKLPRAQNWKLGLKTGSAKVHLGLKTGSAKVHLGLKTGSSGSKLEVPKCTSGSKLEVPKCKLEARAQNWKLGRKTGSAKLEVPNWKCKTGTSGSKLEVPKCKLEARAQNWDLERKTRSANWNLRRSVHSGAGRGTKPGSTAHSPHFFSTFRPKPRPKPVRMPPCARSKLLARALAAMQV